ncbi:FkbM family methyltransferase [Nocardia takedensis]
MTTTETPVEQLFWRLVIGVGRVAGMSRIRPVAARLMTWAAVGPAGHRFHSQRLVVPPPSAPKGYPTPLPESWWLSDPEVRTRRLGLLLELDLRDNLQRSVYFTGTYEPDTLACLRGLLRPGDVFVDVGAHIGIHALTAARAVGPHGRVVAFEPAADSAARLRAGAARNRLPVEVVEAALGERDGAATLYTDPAWGPRDAGVRSLHGAGEAVQRVAVREFDGWATESGLARMDVVKLDVEGAEPAALRGMRESLARFRPRAVIVEMRESVLARAGSDAAEVDRLLVDSGYAASGSVDRNALYEPRER